MSCMPGSIRESAMPEPVGTGTNEPDVAARMRAAPIADAWGSLLRHKPALLGALVLVAIAMMALFSPWIAPSDPAQHFLGEARRAPPPRPEGDHHMGAVGGRRS